MDEEVGSESVDKIRVCQRNVKIQLITLIHRQDDLSWIRPFSGLVDQY